MEMVVREVVRWHRARKATASGNNLGRCHYLTEKIPPCHGEQYLGLTIKVTTEVCLVDARMQYHCLVQYSHHELATQLFLAVCMTLEQLLRLNQDFQVLTSFYERHL